MPTHLSITSAHRGWAPARSHGGPLELLRGPGALVTRAHSSRSAELVTVGCGALFGLKLGGRRLEVGGWRP